MIFMFFGQSIIDNILNFFSIFIADFQYLISNPIGFLDEYFWSAPGYNLYNTIVYVFFLILGSIFIIGKLLIWSNESGKLIWKENFIEIRMEKKFFLAILPYIFLGSVLRALQDIAVQGKILDFYSFMSNRLFVTPGVYVFIMIVALGFGLFSICASQGPYEGEMKLQSLILATFTIGERTFNIKFPMHYIVKPVLFITSKIAVKTSLYKNTWFKDWRNTFFTFGAIFLVFFSIPLLPLFNKIDYVVGGIVIIGLSLLFNLPFYLLHKKFPQKIHIWDFLALFGQMFDAFATVISIEFYQYIEKHYLPSLLFDTPLNSWPFLILKSVAVLLLIWVMKDIEKENDELARWLLWVIFLQGIATGSRDTLRLMTNT